MMTRHQLTLFCFAAILMSLLWQLSLAQERPVIKVPEVIRFEAKAVIDDPFDPSNQRDAKGEFKVRRRQLVRIEVRGIPSPGYYTYSLTKKTARQHPLRVARMVISDTPGITPVWPIVETDPVAYFSKDEGHTYFKHSHPFTWFQDVYVSQDAAPGMVTIPIKLDMQVCNKGGCNQVIRETQVSFEVTPEEPLPMTPEVEARLAVKKPSIEIVTIKGEEAQAEEKVPAKDVAGAPGNKSAPVSAIIEAGLIKKSAPEYKAGMVAIDKQIIAKDGVASNADSDLLGFMLAGVLWGAISLVTPCVFPMIPITVSFFLKQSEKEHHRPVVMASVYSLTIIIVLTVAATALLSTFRLLSVHPITNYLIGGLFIFFALSLFGMYEIELPSSLAQFTSAREGKGGLVGTIFMALTFTIISFACVAPFLGGFSGTAAAARPMWHNLLGGLAFSATFAAPFFLLALFPALLRKLPKSGSWLNVVKVVMGFLELAAAFKFFRSAELIQTIGEPSFFTFDLILGLWIALCVAAALYLIGVYRLPHDTPEEHVSVPRLLTSVAFIGLAFYLAPALFKVDAAGQPQRPTGAVYAWIDSFLLPEAGGGESEFPHTANLEYAVRAAREELKKTGKPKRIFIDFTGVICTNCNKNEKNVFAKPGIGKLFEPYEVVKLYADAVPSKYYAPEIRAELAKDSSRSEEDAKRVNLPFQLKHFKTEQLPLYVVLEPDETRIHIVGVYPEGLINDVPAFAEFLRNPEKQ